MIIKINQHKGYFEEKTAKLLSKRIHLKEQKAQFEIKQKEFQKLYNEYWPKILLGMNSESQINFLRKDNEDLNKENDCLIKTLIKNEIDPLST